jgi:hypothetical protein
MFSKIKTCKTPHQNPERTTERIENEKPPPVHSQNSGGYAIQLAQNVDEAGEGNSDRTKSRKNIFNLFQHIRIESNLLAVTQDNAATEYPPNDVSDVVTENCSRG